MTNDEVISLKEFLEKQNALQAQLFNTRIEGIEKAFCLAKDSQERRLVEAKEAVDKRLDAMNEFRGAIEDQRSSFLTRTEYNLMHDKIIDDVRALNKFKDEQSGKASQSSVNLAMFLGVGGLIIAVAGIIIAIVLH